MRALLLEVPEELLRERRAIGADRFDEVWQGVLHMVPPPTHRHQNLEGELLALLVPLARSRDMCATPETGMFDAVLGEHDYRVPDIVVAHREHLTARGVEGGAVLVIEILSPNDETYEKFDFYSLQPVEHLLVLDQATCGVELHVLDGGRYRQVQPDDEGFVPIDALDLRLRTVEVDGDPGLQAVTPDGTTTIVLFDAAESG